MSFHGFPRLLDFLLIIYQKMCLCPDVCTHLHPDTCLHACKNVQASLHVYKYACCQTRALELIANNGCQLGSRCCRQHNWAQVDCFSTGSKERERDEMAKHRESVARREVRVITEGGKGHTLRQREATYKSMTASHTNHHRAHCSANYCTSQSQENDKNQHGCVCVGGISVEPHSLS